MILKTNLTLILNLFCIFLFKQEVHAWLHNKEISIKYSLGKADFISLGTFLFFIFYFFFNISSSFFNIIYFIAKYPSKHMYLNTINISLNPALLRKAKLPLVENGSKTPLRL